MKPANDEELGVQFNTTEWVAGAAPEPASEITSGELAALLTTVMLPERLPVVAGANFALITVDCPAAKVTGSANGVVLNPVPLTLIAETETLELPVFVRVTLCVALVPVVRLPKSSEEGAGVS